jgi:hypothetical protein
MVCAVYSNSWEFWVANVVLCHWANGSCRWRWYGPWKCWQPCMQHSVTFEKMLIQIQPCQTQTVGTYCTLRALQILHLNSSDVIFMQWLFGVITFCKWEHYRRWYTRVVQSQSMSKFVHCCVQQILTWNKHPIIVHLLWNSINNSLPTGQAVTRLHPGPLSTWTTPNTALKGHLSCFVLCILFVQLSTDRQITVSYLETLHFHCVHTAIIKLKPALYTAIGTTQ